MTYDKIKHMVDRFLGWRLPENFNPDAGISFQKTFNENTPYPMKHEPTGTNLFDASQAEEMTRYMLAEPAATEGTQDCKHAHPVRDGRGYACADCGLLVEPVTPQTTELPPPDVLDWLKEAAHLLDLYYSGYCPKDVASSLLAKIRINWPSLLTPIPLAEIPASTDLPQLQPFHGADWRGAYIDFIGQRERQLSIALTQLADALRRERRLNLTNLDWAAKAANYITREREKDADAREWEKLYRLSEQERTEVHERLAALRTSRDAQFSLGVEQAVSYMADYFERMGKPSTAIRVRKLLIPREPYGPFKTAAAQQLQEDGK